MKITQKKNAFIDRTARKPEGKWAIQIYKDPKAHYRSFNIIMDELRLAGDDTYCEIGCGGGVLLNMALEVTRSGAAIDHSADMVSLSIEKNRGHVDEGRLEIIQGNAEELPWDSNSFSACGSANMFFFVENPESMLSEVYRVLKPGGRLSMVTVNNSLLSKLSFGWIYSLKTYSNKDMISMFREAGFRNISVRTVSAIYQVCYGEK